MAISLTRVQLATDTVEDLVDACNGNAEIIEDAINGIPTYGVVSGGGLSKSGNNFQMVNTGTAGTYGPSGNVDATGSTEQTINIPQFTTDTKGRVTAVSVRTLKCKNTTYNNASASAAGLVSTGSQTLAGAKTFTGAMSITNDTASSSTGTGALKISGGLGVAKYIYGSRVYNAVWNDYAECREAEVVAGGWCVRESQDGIMKVSTGRLQAGCRLTSDTFGACMGETEKAKTPIAVAGRVLAYPSKRHKRSKWKIGKAVCSSYCGTVDVMNRLECILFPDRIIGYVSEIPDYEVWDAGTKENPHQVFVDGRVWVYVR